MSYTRSRSEIEHGRGKDTYEHVREFAINSSSVFTSTDAIDDVCRTRGACDSHQLLNSLDKLCEEGLIRKLPCDEDTFAQYWQYEKVG